MQVIRTYDRGLGIPRKRPPRSKKLSTYLEIFDFEEEEEEDEEEEVDDLERFSQALAEEEKALRLRYIRVDVAEVEGEAELQAIAIYGRVLKHLVMVLLLRQPSEVADQEEGRLVQTKHLLARKPTTVVLVKVLPRMTTTSLTKMTPMTMTTNQLLEDVVVAEVVVVEDGNSFDGEFFRNCTNFLVVSQWSTSNGIERRAR